MINTASQANVLYRANDEDITSQRLVRVFIIIILLSLSNSLTIFGQLVVHGKADLRNINLDETEVELKGNWKFYWEEFRTPGIASLETDSILFVPGSWSKDNRYPVLGYATYTLDLFLEKYDQPIAISLPLVNSAFKVWVNGKLNGAVGETGSNDFKYKPRLKNSIIYLPDTTQVRLTIQVANFTYFSGGIVRVPVVGNASQLIEKQNKNKSVLNLFAGILLAIFSYQFILFLLYPKGKPYLWLSLICLIIAIRSMIVHGGSFFLPDLFPDVPVELWKKIEFGGVYILGALSALYVYHLYQNVARWLPVLVIICSSTILFLTVLLTPQYTYGKLLDVAHLVILCGIIYSFLTIREARKAGNKEAVIIFYGLFAATPFFMLEIFSNNTIMKIGPMINLSLFYPVEIGLIIFLGFQVYLLARHYAKSFKALSSINIELEQKVNERSKELIETSLVKDKLLSIISHDVKAPISSLKGALMLFNKGLLETNEFKDLTMNLEEELNKTSSLIEKILHWSKVQLAGSQVNKDIFDIKELVENNIQLFKSLASNKAIHFEYSIEPQTICWDKDILNMVLRNLLTNAIKFSHYGGQINIYVKTDEKDITIGVRDFGIGMDDEFMNTLSMSRKIISQMGTKGERGNGIGLALSKEYLVKAGGKLICSSKLNEGTEFLICLSSNMTAK